MRLLPLVLVLWASVASAQTIALPMDAAPAGTVPDFCASVDELTGTISTARIQVNACVQPGVSVTLNAKLTVTNLVIYEGGSLTCGPNAAIDINNTAPTDAGQYGTGIIIAGTFNCVGVEKTRFLRLAAAPAAGATTLTLASVPVGWQSGDRLVLPDSRHLRSNEVTNWAPTTPQWEARTIASINGNVVTLTGPLAYSHPGALDAAGAVSFLPHVANLSASITIRSVSGSTNRGHILATGRANVNLRYLRLDNLGRTTRLALGPSNQVGRYALHAHHLVGPTTPQANGYQFTFIGNAIDGGDAVHDRKWGIAIHASHHGLIQGNVVYNYAGSAYMFEDGSESFNVVDGNFALRSTGVGDRLAIGVEGGGFWFKGPNNYVRNNVAANVFATQPEAAYGFKYFLYYLGNIKVPKYQGADVHVAGQFDTLDGNKLPIRQFENNEVYGAAQGMTYWWVNTFGNPNPLITPATSTFKNLKIWNVYNIGVYHYPAASILWDGLTIRGSYGTGPACCGTGWFGSDYGFHGLTIRNADIQGMRVGITPPMFALSPLLTIEDSTFRNEVDISAGTMWNVGGLNGAFANLNVRPRSIVIRNSTFGAFPGRTRTAAIRRVWDTTTRPSTAYNPTVLDEVKVYRYDESASDHFQAFYAIQASTNVAGGLAPGNAAARADLIGIAAPIAGECTATDATYTDWAFSSATAWDPVACPIEGQRTRFETWTRSELTPASCGGNTYPVTDDRPGTQTCTYVPPTVTCEIVAGLPVCVMSGWPLADGSTFSLVVPEP
jgi:hypothetical protein